MTNKYLYMFYIFSFWHVVSYYCKNGDFIQRRNRGTEITGITVVHNEHKHITPGARQTLLKTSGPMRIYFEHHLRSGVFIGDGRNNREQTDKWKRCYGKKGGTGTLVKELVHLSVKLYCKRNCTARWVWFNLI